MMYNAISLYKHLDVKRFIGTVVGIAVTAAILLVVGSILSTQNG